MNGGAAKRPAESATTRFLRRLYEAALWSIPLSGLTLYAFARTVMGPAVAGLIAWHIVGGLALSAPFLVGQWRSTRSAPANRPDVSGTVFVSAVLTIGTGLALVLWAAAGNSVGKAQLLFAAHLAAGIVLVLLACAPIVRAIRGRRRPSQRQRRIAASRSVASTMLLLAAGALGAFTFDAEGYYRSVTASSAADAGNPRFPAGTRIEGDALWRRAPDARTCARRGCHPAAERSWHSSAHAHASSGDYYRAALRYASEHIGGDGIRWCEGCHSPLSGAVRSERGVGCYSCHAMNQVPLTVGNGYATFAPPAAYPFADAAGGLRRAAHDFLVRVRPGPHQAGLAGPPGPASEATMCQPCHRLSVKAPQNHYKFLRYDSTWTDWQAGPFSGESVHGFAGGQPRRTCASCHMPPVGDQDIAGTARDHGCSQAGEFGPSSTAGQWAGPRQGRSFLTVEVFAIRRAGAEPGSAERIDAPLRSRPVVVRAGETVWADVLVGSSGIGHAFPTGVPDLRDVWLEFRVETPDGRVLLISRRPGTGDAAPGGDGGLEAHRYGLLALDREGNPLYRGNVYDMVGQAYRFSEGNAQGRALRYRAVLPGIGDVARFRFRVPAAGRHDLILVARVVSRAYNRPFARWASLVTPGSAGGRLAEPPTVVLAEDREVIGAREARQSSPIPSPQYARRRDDPRDSPRLVAYGASLLMQNDVPRARRAFQEAISLTPASADAWTALGRAFLEEGDLLTAQAKLQHALEIEPANPRAGVWLGRTYRLMGKYDLALRTLEPLAQRYPRDILTWLDIGLCRMQSGRPEEAIAAFQRMLDVDPDDPTAHLNLMQCYRRLLRISDARREEVIYRTLQDADTPATIVDAYMRAHPEERLEAQPIHEHVLRAAGQ